MISFILDGILIAICAFVLFFSVKRGFVRTILSIVSSVAAILISVVFTPTVSEFIYNKFLLNSITSGISGTVSSLAGSDDGSGVIKLFEDMPEAFDNILTRYNVSNSSAASMLEGAKNGTENVSSISEKIASPVASTISNALAFIICFVVAMIILKIIIAVIDNFFKLPLLNSANKTAGVILGVVLVFVVLSVYSSVAVQLVDALGSVSPELFGKNAIDGTIIVKFFSEHNIFGIIKDAISKNTVL
ncbi:MAG: CvpA family protein [Ruminococcaceae bacterium]|nr:CvpA family protein [Oscillospiraceae bacterium]